MTIARPMPRVVTAEQFRQWIGHARNESVCEWHVGDIALDSQKHPTVAELLDAVRAASRRGDINMFSITTRPGRTIYRARRMRTAPTPT
jgi:hypothetical protein